MRAKCVVIVTAIVMAMVLAACTGIVDRTQAFVEPPLNDWLARRPLNIAHAGGDLEAPHETMFAFGEAVANGADVLELDVRLSADRELMVIHDAAVDRTTGATGAVGDLTAAQLQALDNAYWFVPECWSCHDRPTEEYMFRGVRSGDRVTPSGYEPDDFGIPTLRQVFERFPHRLLDIEIKDGPNGMAAADLVATLIDEYDRANRVMVVSFDDEIMEHFREVAPHIPTAPGLGVVTQWFIDRGELPYDTIQVPPVYSGIEVLTRQFVSDAHDDGGAVWAWFNGNDDDVESEWGRLLDMGVDGLITGRPKRLQTFLDARETVFKTRLAVEGPLDVYPVPMLPVRCPASTADSCKVAVVIMSAIGRDRSVLVLAWGIVDLEPGAATSVALVRGEGSWRRAAKEGAFGIVWPIVSDVASALIPISLTR
ncbi:MAG: glycerophosphodiester phosphodiesterase [Acidimicrobiia bacterium]|nr:glycerophosphodiester phosphodiesterase [Acidimicrobiia bacterium]